MKAIVTGGAGFIGSHIADWLINEGVDVIVIDNLSSGYERNIPKKAKFIKADICDGRSYKKELDGCEVIFHNAASKKNICLNDPQRDLQVNAGGTLGLLHLAYEYKVKKFVHASTGSVYGQVAHCNENTCFRPVSYYGVSKMAGESYVKLFSNFMDTAILRYFHVYGPRQETDPDLGGVIAIFADRIKQGLPITIHGDGKQIRQFTHVSDVVKANKIMLENYTDGQAFNVANMERMTVQFMAYILREHFNKQVPIIYDDPLPGDIKYFDVDSSSIQDYGLEFMPFNKGVETL